jgi:hypothetical protein
MCVAAPRSSFAAALPPDVRRRLCLAENGFLSSGLRPSFGLWPKPLGHSPDQGHSPFVRAVLTAGQSPRRTSGGEAVANGDLRGSAAYTARPTSSPRRTPTSDERQSRSSPNAPCERHQAVPNAGTPRPPKAWHRSLTGKRAAKLLRQPLSDRANDRTSGASLARPPGSGSVPGS